MKRVLSGLRAWLLQRLSALVMLALLPWALLMLRAGPPRSYPAWHALIHQPLVGTAVGVFFSVLLLHAWVGLRDVVMDYVHSATVRIGLLSLIALGSAALALWLLRILL